ncbi:unnamed protein product, partial [Ectocarpus fasciculatus]
MDFSPVFYDALFENGGRTVKQAFDIALNYVNATHPGALTNQEGGHFLLLPKGKKKKKNADGNHDVRIFDTLSEGQLVDETQPLPPRPPCKKAARSYMGQARVQHVVRLLMTSKAVCVTITGEHGSGKTELAIQACDYVRERHHFDSFLWADCDRAVLAADSDASTSSANPFFFFPNSPDDASGGDSVSMEDLCRLIGLAIGMPQPGPSSEQELHQFIFKKPNTDSGQPFQKVLLVLDNVHSLLERGGDAQERLVELLSSLCSRGGGGHLKLLATSEHKLLSGNECFHGGTEMVVKVERLETRHASELLMDNLPRDFQPKELGLKSGGLSLTDVLIAMENHPVLKEVLEIAEGHPGTLVRLGPKLLDGSLDDACRLKEAATRLREGFRDTSCCRKGVHRRSGSRASAASSIFAIIGKEPGEAESYLTASPSPITSPYESPAPATPSHHPTMTTAVSDDACHRRNRRTVLNRTNSSIDGGRLEGGGRWGVRQALPPRKGEGAGLAKAQGSHKEPRDRDAILQRMMQPRHHRRQVMAWDGPRPQQAPSLRLHHQYDQERQDRVAMVHQQRRRVMAQEALDEAEPLCLINMEEQHAWDIAEVAGVDERGCRLVWVTATKSMVDGWRRDIGSDGGREWASMRGKFVSWKYLRESLALQLVTLMTVPSSISSGGGRHDAPEDTSTPYTYLDDEDEVHCEEVEVDDADEEEEEEEEEEDQERAGGERRAWHRRMRSLPHTTRVLNKAELEFIRGILRRGQVALAKAGVETVDCTEFGLDGRYDFISVEAFVKFTLWWAPLMETLGIIGSDWASTKPLRVHGFIGRLEAERQLLERDRGTFLWRFSESYPGKLVVSCAHHHYLVEVTTEGRCWMAVDNVGSGREYASLHDLVRQTRQFTMLYPDIPKWQVFNGGSNTAAST